MIGIKFSVIKPKKQLDPDVFRAELFFEAKKIAKEIKEDFDKTASTWDHRPNFYPRYQNIPSLISLEVTTDDKIYGYVDKGTEGGKILKPAKGKALMFDVGGSPKTVPGRLTPGAGSYGSLRFSKGPIVTKGIHERGFSTMLKFRWEKQWYDRMYEALNRAARKCGHAI